MTGEILMWNIVFINQTMNTDDRTSFRLSLDGVFSAIKICNFDFKTNIAPECWSTCHTTLYSYHNTRFTSHTAVGANLNVFLFYLFKRYYYYYYYYYMYIHVCIWLSKYAQREFSASITWSGINIVMRCRSCCTNHNKRWLDSVCKVCMQCYFYCISIHLQSSDKLILRCHILCISCKFCACFRRYIDMKVVILTNISKHK